MKLNFVLLHDVMCGGLGLCRRRTDVVKYVCLKGIEQA